MTGVAYIRVSTEDQAGEDAYGLDAQKDAVEKYCGENNIDLLEIFQDTISGSLDERPGLIALLEQTKSGKIAQVIVPKLDRLSRDTLYCLWIEKELRKNGVELVSIAEPYRWDDPMQKMMLTIVAAFAEYEKELIKMRMGGGRKAKARHGGYAGGRPCIGYKVEKGKKVLQLDDLKTDTVRRVFEIKDANPKLFLREIASKLNAEGLTPAKGKKFYPVQVQRILNRRNFYEGVYSYAGIEANGQHEGILGE
jgi:DNA invertase Pin-like site-specific DNA recombinase